MNKLPSGWQIKSLGEVSEIIAGQSPPSATYNKNKIGLPFYQGKTDFGETYPSVRVWCSNPTKIALPNDILISVRAPVGPTNICDTEACIGRGLNAIRAKENSNYKFILYFLRTIENKLANQGRGSTFSAITQSELKEISIPFPSLPIQKQIAEILEKADQAKQKRKEANKLTEQFLQSAFIEMFGDPVKNPKRWNTEQIGNTIKYSEYGTSKKSNKVGSGYPILSMSNITYDGRIDLTNISYVELNKNEFSKLRLIHGDVIFNRTNSTELIGKTAYWDKELDFVIASYLVKLQLKPTHNPIWFSYLLNTKYFKNLFALKCKKAVNQSNISPTLLKEFTMYSPPLPLQQQFADLVQKTEALKEKQKKSEIGLENLFNILMQKAFKGELAL
jgi:type I restriction enzyme S subunit